MAQKDAPAGAERPPVAAKQSDKDCSAALLRDSQQPGACSPQDTAPKGSEDKPDEFHFPGHSHGHEEGEGSHEGWKTAVHGDIKVQLNHQSGPRGSNSLDSINWLSYDAEKEVKGGDLSIRGMISLEPWTTSGGGTNQLFQNGGAYKGEPILDAQHAHNFLSELSVNYTKPVADNTRISVAAGIGAPALGPIYFHQHDLTLGTDLSHHFLEGTHNSNGFATIGIQHNKFQLEGSVFHGRESDNRRAITIGAPDSVSLRAAYAPTENIVLQVSHGMIKSPESLEPGDVERTTISAAHQVKWTDGSWKNLIAWGRNNESHGSTQAFRAETIFNFNDKNTIFGRYENVEKHGLADTGAHAIEVPNPSAGVEEEIFPIQSFSIGAMRNVVTTDKFKVGIGADLTKHKIPEELKSVYGPNPIGARVFMRVTF